MHTERGHLAGLGVAGLGGAAWNEKPDPGDRGRGLVVRVRAQLGRDAGLGAARCDGRPVGPEAVPADGGMYPNYLVYSTSSPTAGPRSSDSGCQRPRARRCRHTGAAVGLTDRPPRASLYPAVVATFTGRRGCVPS